MSDKTKIIKGFEHVSYKQETFDAVEMEQRSEEFYKWLEKRRSVREFSDRPVAKQVIDNIILLEELTIATPNLPYF